MTSYPPQRFVYVEDDPNQRMILDALFRHERVWNELICLDGVRSFRQYLDDAERPSIDVLIVDWRLKDGSGAEVIAAAREHPKTKAAAILAASAVSEHAQIAEADRMGGHYWLEKPLTVSMIIDALTAINGFGQIIVRKKK